MRRELVQAMICTVTLLVADRASRAQTGVAGQVDRPGRRAPTAQPFRLRADAVGQARTPTGVLLLQAQVDPADWVRGEALVWGGTGELGEEADALVARVTLSAPNQIGELHLGRMIVGPGAIRPLHMDGASGLVRLPWHMALEAFGGWTVAPRFAERDYDWAAGGRVAQTLPGWGTIGVAYLHRRIEGRLADQELGGDLSLTLGEDVDFIGRAAWDMQSPGLSEALGSIAFHPGDDWRFEIYGSHRSPSRILPATSLFSVLGDIPAQRLAGRIRWRAAPRLDVIVDGGARTFDDTVGEMLQLRVVLRLDSFGASSLSGEVTRNGGPPTVAFTGVRAAFRWQIASAWMLSTELEVVRPDQSDQIGSTQDVLQTPSGLTAAPSRGSLWPWGIVALEYRPDPAWVLAAAIEGSATSELQGALDGLARVTWLWGGP